ncbi:MAG: TIGR03668 family PPOX class F420-dependent oxidoreductase [Deltaproteobacteria bacterium]
MIAEPTDREKEIIQSSRIARMATADDSGTPAVIPVCFAYDRLCLYTPIDKKPKTPRIAELGRIKNISVNPNVSVVIDRYFEDWKRLFYIIIKGRASILESGEEYENSLRALCGKYYQYRKMRLDQAGLPVIKIVPARILSWGNIND